MPTHPVINRRNVDSPLVRKTVLVSPEGLDAAAALAKRLHVSQGSVIDTALLAFARLKLGDVINQLRDAGHLIGIEYGAVMKVAGLDEESDHT